MAGRPKARGGWELEREEAWGEVKARRGATGREREQWWRGVVRRVVECGGSQQWFAFVDCASSVVCGCGVWGVRTAGVWRRVRRAVRGVG